MKNFVQPGDCLTLTAPTGGVVSGNGYQIGQMFVVATHDAAAGAVFSGCTEGVFALPKATGQTWAEGALIYWDNTNKYCTTTSTSNLRIGSATAVGGEGSADTTGEVRLSGNPAPAGA